MAAHFGRNNSLDFIEFIHCLKRKSIRFHYGVHEDHNGAFFQNLSYF